MVKLHGENEKETKGAKVLLVPDEHFMYTTKAVFGLPYC